MIIYPAMDLMGGRVVRLKQGRFEDSTTYSPEPVEALHAFAEAGAEWAHVVDLDGARATSPVQHELIAQLACSTPLKLQVGGGFRTRQQIARMLDSGVERVVVGSLAFKEPDLVNAWIRDFGPEHLTLSLDVRVSDGMPLVSVSGWTEASGASLWNIAALYPTARHLLLTDIARDGMLMGPNVELLEEATRRLPHLRVQASGGITSTADLARLSTDGAIIGKAIWDGLIPLQEALFLARA